MNRVQTQMAYGLLIAITGIIIAILSSNPSRTLQYTVAAGMLLSAVFAFATTAKAKHAVIPMKYNRMQGVGILIYGFAILIYASNFERFILTTMAFTLYFGITEILFGFKLLAYKEHLALQVIVARMVIGFIMAVGAVLILTIAMLDKNASLLFAGILMTISGLTFIWFAGLTKKLGMQSLGV